MYKIKNFGLSELMLEDLHLFNKYIKASTYFTGLWASNFPYIWSISRLKNINVYWKIIDSMLVTFIMTKKGFMYVWCLPFGKGNADYVISVTKKGLELCNDWNALHNYKKSAYVNLLNEKQIQFLASSNSFRKTFLYKKFDSKEIIWSVDKITQLKGKEYREIRAIRNKLHRDYPSITFREYSPSDYKGVLALKELWNKTSGQKYERITDRNLFHQILHHYQELNEMIYVATIEEEIVGFVTGSILPNGLSWGCLAKAHPNYKGVSIYLYTEFAKVIRSKDPNVSLIHVGSDNNEKGLRYFKEKFRPVEKLSQYALKLR
ncbi:hypothetical protein CJ195_09060 [Bacillus sp. UMB0899]|nr:hypothetical protein CJ195_09060 [Bacillus sp. UMB0899]